RKKRLPQIDVENPRRSGPRGLQEFPYRASRNFRTLRQRTETHGIRRFGQRLPSRSPLEMIPSYVFHDRVLRLSFRIDLDLHRPRRMLRVRLNQRSVQPARRQLPDRFLPQPVAAHAARHNSAISQQRRHVRKIRRRPAELFALREKIPQQFTQPYDGVPARRHEMKAVTRRVEGNLFVARSSFRLMASRLRDPATVPRASTPAPRPVPAPGRGRPVPASDVESDCSRPSRWPAAAPARQARTLPSSPELSPAG